MRSRGVREPVTRHNSSKQEKPLVWLWWWMVIPGGAEEEEEEEEEEEDGLDWVERETLEKVVVLAREELSSGRMCTVAT